MKKVTFKEVIKISRPRFWIYELGTFVLGVFAGVFATGGDWGSQPWLLLLFGFYFLLPANILIYGVNDIFDYETDKLNPKKVAYESLLIPEKHKSVWIWIVLTNLPFLVLLFLLSSKSLLAFVLFFCCAFFYSAWPVRAKIRPFFDSLLSAGHYTLTGVFGYFLVASNSSWPWLGILAGLMWAMAMHAYSAVPDIASDKGAGFSTIATWLGPKRTVTLCLVFYILSGVIGAYLLTPLVLVPLLLYVWLMLKSLPIAKNEKLLMRVYAKFPLVNFFTGFLLTMWMVFNQLL